MDINPTPFGRTIVTVCVVAFNCILLILLPFSVLTYKMQAQGNESSKIAARLESFERNMKALLSNKTNTDPITANANMDTTNSNGNESIDSVTNGRNIASTPPPQSSSVSPPCATAPSISKQSSPSLLINDVKHFRVQSNEAALSLSDKIDDTQEANQVLKAQIATLEGQLQDQRSKINNTRNRMANRLDILERYIQNGTKLQDQRIQENQQVQALSQRSTDLINQRIDALEEQLIVSFKEIDEKRSKELQYFVGTSKSLNNLCNDIKIKLDKQALMVAEHDKEIAKNTETIRTTFSSEALAALEKGVCGALDMCNSKLVKMEEGHKEIQALLEGTSDKLKTASDTLISMQTKFQVLKEDVTVDLSNVNGKLGWMSENIYKNAQQLGFECDLLDHQAANDNPTQQTKEDKDATL